MAETHELRLKINAAAAKSGSRDFVRAIAAIKVAIRGLEKDSAGIFKKLSKRTRDAGKSAKVKIGGVDKSAIRSLDQFVKSQGRALRATANTRKGLTSLTAGMRRASESYLSAGTASLTLNKSLSATNMLLSRQVTLAKAAAEAMRQATTASSGVRSVGGGGGGGGPSSKDADKAISDQLRIARALADATLQAERLATQLARVGAGGSIREVGQALERLRTSMGNAAGDTKKMATAQSEFKLAMTGISTGLVTLNAKLSEEAAALRNTASAAREKAKAARDSARATTELARTEGDAAKGAERQARLQLASAAAMRQVEQETARLSDRLRRLGDTKGIESLNSALGRFRMQANAGFNSTLQLKQGVSQFADAAGKAKVNITGLSSAQAQTARTAKNLARAERDASRQARMLARNMRGAGTASNTASKSFRNATGNLRGMENAFSLSFQAGSAFRSMIGGITLGVFTTSVFAAGNALDQFRVTMQVATDSAAEAAEQFDFIDSTARGLGVSLRGAREDFSKFAIASDIAGVSAQTTRNIFHSVALAMAVLGRSSEDQRLSFLALEQMMSKGVISSEELRRQLGERLPGAVNIMARAIGVTTGELQKLLKAGKLISAEVLPKFAAELNKIFGPGLDAAMKRAGTQLGVFKVEFEKFLEASAQSGLMQQLSFEFRDLTSLMRSPATARAGESLGLGLAKAAKTIAIAAKFIIRNINEIKEVAVAVFTGILARQGVLFGKALVIMAQNLFTFVGGLRGLSGAEAINTAAVQANTMALAAQAEILAITNFEKAKAAAVTGTKTAMTALDTAEIAKNNAVQLSANASLAGQTRGFGRIASGAGKLARGMLALAGPIGIVIAGITLLPLLFGKTESAADEAATAYESAIRRMGTANDTLSPLALAIDEETLEQAVKATANAVARINIETSKIQINIKSEGNLEREMLDVEKIIQGLGTNASVVVGQFLQMGRNLATTTERGEGLKDLLSEIRSKRADVGGLFLGQKTNIEIEEVIVLLDELVRAMAGSVAGFEDIGGKIGSVLASALITMKTELGELNQLLEDGQTKAETVFGTFTQAINNRQLFDKDARKNFTDLRLTAQSTSEELIEARRQVTALLESAEGGRGMVGITSLGKILIITLDAAIGAKDAIEGLSDKIERLEEVINPTNVALKEQTRLINLLTRSTATFANTQRAIAGAGSEVLKDFADSARLAALTGDAAAEEAFRQSKKGGEAFALIQKELIQGNAELIAQNKDLGGASQSDENQRLLSERMEANRLIAETQEATLLAGAVDEARRKSAEKGSKKAISDLKREMKALEKLRDQSLTTAGAMAALKETTRLLGTEQAKQVFTTEEMVVVLREVQFETFKQIAAEGALGAAFVTTAEMMGKTEEQIELLIQSRIIMNELTEGGTKVLTAQNQALLENFQIQKRLQDLEDQRKDAQDAQAEFISGTQKEIDVMRLLNSGMFENKEIAEIVLDLKRAGITLSADSINMMNLESATLERLTTLSGGPAQAWLDSVPDMVEAGQMLEAKVFGGLSDAMVAFAQTGKFSFDSLLNDLQAMSMKILADKAIKKLFEMLGGNPGAGDFFGLSSDISVDSTQATQEGIQQAFSFGNTETREAITASFTLGSTEANTKLLSAFEQGGMSAAEKMRRVLSTTTVSVDASGVSGFGFGGGGGVTGGGGGSGLADDIGTRMTQAGESAGSAIAGHMTESGDIFGMSLTSIFEGGASSFSGIFASLGSMLGGAIGGTTGSGIGNLIGTILPLVLGSLFEKGGISNAPTAANPSVPIPAALFQNAPSFKSGTANTSGIPALLHDNEAVVPLTAGRKIPIEGSGGPKQEFNISQSFIFPEGDVDSFRKSTNQIAADTAAVVNRAVKANS